jgi:hypothetical protein
LLVPGGLCGFNRRGPGRLNGKKSPQPPTCASAGVPIRFTPISAFPIFNRASSAMKKDPAEAGPVQVAQGDGLAPPAPRTVSDLET